MDNIEIKVVNKRQLSIDELNVLNDLNGELMDSEEEEVRKVSKLQYTFYQEDRNASNSSNESTDPYDDWDDGDRLALLYLNDHIVGMGVGVIMDDPRKAYVSHLVVSKKYRGKGYSKRIMTHLLNDPHFKKVKHWRLGASVNPAALALYKSLGFNPISITMVKDV